MPTAPDRVEGLARRVLAGDRRALGRALSLAETDDAAGAALCRRIGRFPTVAPVLGFTGAPGAGKSTLVNAYVALLRGEGLTVAVLAVDPTSPFTGGAILGDRIRMIEHLGDEGVFVRSLAAHGHLGGLTATVDRLVALVDAAGWDRIVLETVGTGQSETQLADVADVNIMVMAPGQGDDVQVMKAGALEAADILVVNKSDLPQANRVVRQLGEMNRLAHGGGSPVPVISAVALDGRGVAELHQCIAKRLAARLPRGDADVARRLLDEVGHRLRQRLANRHAAAVDSLCHDIRTGVISLHEGAAQLEALLLGTDR